MPAGRGAFSMRPGQVSAANAEPGRRERGERGSLYEIPITLPLRLSRKPMRRVAPQHPTEARTLFLSPRRTLRIGAPHVGHRHAGARPRLLRGGNRLRLRLRTSLSFDAFPSHEAVSASCKMLLRNTTMIFDYSLAALVSAGLLFYLTYALLRPERF